MLTCKEIVKILSSEERSSWRRRIEIRMHLFMCHHCNKYAKHLHYLNQGLRQLFKAKSKEVTPEEISKIEAEVLRKLK